MAEFVIILYAALVACTIGAIVHGFKLLGRLARAQERTASALEIIARKLEGGAKL
jgi:hypothetical protein